MTLADTSIDLGTVDRLIADCGTDLAATIPLLQGIQTTFGYVPVTALARVAEKTEIPASHLFGVATFYKQFRLKPVGKHMVRVCLGTACHVQGGGRIHELTRETLELADGEDTTKDLLFTVDPVACLGCCSLAPVVMVDKTTHGRLDATKTRKLFKKLHKDASSAQG
jgi:NADH:ubiquinone oxidoreductase subunit E